MRVIAVSLFAAVSIGVVWVLLQIPDVTQWAVAQQRGFQNAIADGVFGLKTGTPGAWAALLGAAGAYGFVHAVGPGHGKYLIGGVGLGSSVSAGRLLGLAFASSLAQALWAILLVYGGFYVLSTTAEQVSGLAEDWLAPASYFAIALIGAVLVWRGGRRLMERKQAHTHECGCHAHGPSVEEAQAVGSLREAVALVLSIAVRPCTGAIFLLVIAWQMDIRFAGAAAVVTMGLGTAGLTCLVAYSTVTARRLAVLGAGDFAGWAVTLPLLQMFAGALILWASLLLLGNAL